MHHVRLSETHDPDVVDTNFGRLRESGWPMAARYAFVTAAAATWKFSYYAPTTLMDLLAARAASAGEPAGERSIVNKNLWDPRTKRGRKLWTSCYLPYAAFHFAALPLAFCALGPWAEFSTYCNAIIGEVVANVHSHLIIVPNHAGDNLTCFDTPPSGKAELYLRQIPGKSQDGGDVNDCCTTGSIIKLNITCFSSMSQLEYQKLQPRVKALCEKYGIPDVQQSVWQRAKKTLDIMVGRSSMKRWPRPIGGTPLAGPTAAGHTPLTAQS